MKHIQNENKLKKKIMNIYKLYIVIDESIQGTFILRA